MGHCASCTPGRERVVTRQMKKVLVALLAATLAYLILHVVVFAANTGYRNRFDDPAYMAGEVTKTYYAMTR